MQSKTNNFKINAFIDSSLSLSAMAAVNFDEVSQALDNPVLIDAIKNGQAQKLELTTELCWKAIKVVLSTVDGIDEVSPKKVVKAFFIAGHITEQDYLGIMQAIDDRNQLSHVYDENVFNAILDRLQAHATMFEALAKKLAQFKTNDD